jgi:hypothetical protein
VNVEWPAVIIGLVVVAAGIVGLRYRRPIAKANAAAQRFEVVRNSSTPTVVLAVSIFWMCFGVILVLVGIFAGPR